MSHAIVRAGGKQFLVEEGQTIRVPSFEAEAGSSVELEMLLTTGEKKISATVVAHGKVGVGTVPDGVNPDVPGAGRDAVIDQVGDRGLGRVADGAK